MYLFKAIVLFCTLGFIASYTPIASAHRCFVNANGFVRCTSMGPRWGGYYRPVHYYRPYYYGYRPCGWYRGHRYCRW